MIELAYGVGLEEHLADFDDQPIASASVAQVHSAKLGDGTEVVVKVLRPGSKNVIDEDLGLLYALAHLADKHWSEGKRLRPVEIVEEYHKTIYDEMDLMREAANATQLRHNFPDSDLIYVPRVYWEHTRRDVMVMERVRGIPVRDVDAIRNAGVDMKQLAHNGVEIFFTQAFRDGFFHADMHPGNIFVGPDGQYRAVDFGIMGILNDSDKRYLAENFLAFFNRDYRAVAQAHIRAGWVPPDTPTEEFESAVRTVCEPIFAKPISEISFGRLVIRLFQVARRFNMPIQPQLILLQKTLLNIEGLGRQLYPQLDLWETAKPFLERWMRDQIGPSALLRDLRQQWPQIAPLLPELPALVHGALRRLHHEQRRDRISTEEIDRLRQEFTASERRFAGTVLGCVLLLLAPIVAVFPELATPLDLNWLSGLVGACGGLLVVFSWFSGTRRRALTTPKNRSVRPRI